MDPILFFEKLGEEINRGKLKKPQPIDEQEAFRKFELEYSKQFPNPTKEQRDQFWDLWIEKKKSLNESSVNSSLNFMLNYSCMLADRKESIIAKALTLGIEKKLISKKDPAIEKYNLDTKEYWVYDAFAAPYEITTSGITAKETSKSSYKLYKNKECITEVRLGMDAGCLVYLLDEPTILKS